MASTDSGAAFAVGVSPLALFGATKTGCGETFYVKNTGTKRMFVFIPSLHGTSPGMPLEAGDMLPFRANLSEMPNVTVATTAGGSDTSTCNYGTVSK